MKTPNKKFCDIVEAVLLDTKAENVIKIDLFNKSTLCDYIFIVTGTSGRHVKALANNVIKEFKKIGINTALEGGDSDNWLVLDIGDVIIHIFQKNTRDLYRLEEIWQRK